jgi:hypothetical protein
MFDYEGSAEWMANQNEIWCLSRWSLKEHERIEEENKRNVLFF